MKKIFLALILFISSNLAYATTTEVFDGMDENALKAGISKYILTRGGVVNHGESYSSNTFQAVEQRHTKRGIYTYNYVFKLTPLDESTRLDLTVYYSAYGMAPKNVEPYDEQKIMEAIKGAIKGRLLYGLGFDFDTYTYEGGKIKAPKGRETGIVLTTVKYDALKKGLMAGDVITEVNGVPLNKIPLKEYATILNAKSMTDTLNLTVKRNGNLINVTLTPRLSNNRTF